MASSVLDLFRAGTPRWQSTPSDPHRCVFDLRPNTLESRCCLSSSPQKGLNELTNSCSREFAGRVFFFGPLQPRHAQPACKSHPMKLQLPPIKKRADD